MERHLNEVELSDAMMGDASAATRKHLSECPRCEADRQQLANALQALQSSAQQLGDRPPHFFAAQRAKIISQVTRSSQRTPRFAWAGLAATVAIALTLLMHSPSAQVPETPVERVQATVSDHDLMLAVEDELDSGLPDALEPAGVLAQEMNQAANKYSKQHSFKEN